jgi:hypothetical protein
MTDNCPNNHRNDGSRALAPPIASVAVSLFIFGVTRRLWREHELFV